MVRALSSAKLGAEVALTTAARPGQARGAPW